VSQMTTNMYRFRTTKYMPLTYMQDRLLSWLGTDTAITSRSLMYGP